jgi:hypothetical protein
MAISRFGHRFAPGRHARSSFTPLVRLWMRQAHLLTIPESFAMPGAAAAVEAVIVFEDLK